jgi:organic hydroperoxide reductase OsmC/OhrA
MTPYPHTYTVTADAAATGLIPLSAVGLPTLQSAPPAEFDGPGDVWSPETLLVASVADCFILTFRAVARASSFGWERLECHVDGVLARADGVTRFTRYTTHATLTLMPGADQAKAKLLLEKAEKGCLVANSLNGERHLEIELLETSA